MANEVITYYSKTPPNKFEMTDYTVKNAEDNRNCSDTMEVFLKIEDWKIQDWSFVWVTSIVTTACASVFWESIIWMNLDEVLEKKYEYIQELVWEEISPRRQKWAVFGLVATKNAIHKYLNDWISEDILSNLP